MLAHLTLPPLDTLLVLVALGRAALFTDALLDLALPLELLADEAGRGEVLLEDVSPQH